jgi:hypothetical protein
VDNTNHSPWLLAIVIIILNRIKVKIVPLSVLPSAVEPE